MEQFPPELSRMRSWTDAQYYCYVARKSITEIILRCKEEGYVYCRFVIGFHGDVYWFGKLLHVDEDHFLKDVIAKSEQHLESEVEVKTQRKVIETLKGELEAIYGDSFRIALSSHSTCLQLYRICLK